MSYDHDTEDDACENLLDIIGHSAANEPNYCAPDGEFYRWETDVASPLLKSLGYTILRWYSIERDSFGPLIRGVWVRKNNKDTLLSYG